ncbi:hypothetical protein HDU79_000857 [Rhizoclosmatium sp. JEL0117]|nr:hypothetical protein HDU79_000857 [Rhizoclosmatium sp. JEL0117]
MFVNDVDLHPLSQTSKWLRRLVFDKVVRHIHLENNKKRIDTLIQSPQRRTRQELAEINVLRGPPGIQRRLTEGDYVAGEGSVQQYHAYVEVQRDFLVKGLVKRLERRPSSEAVTPLAGANILTNSPVIVPKMKQLERAMTADVIKKELRRHLSVPVEILS